MGKRDELIALYAADMKEKCGVTADMALLTKVTIGLGPSVYRADASTVSGSAQSELDTVKKSFLIGKLGLPDTAALDEAIAGVIEQYGRSNRKKYRAVIYYLLVKKFKRESVYA